MWGNTILSFEEYGHWTIVGDLDQHMGAEFSPLGWDAQFFEQDRETFHQGFGDRWGGRIGEGGTATFTCVSVQGELRDNDRAPADFAQGAVHLTVLVLEDAQIGDLVRQVAGLVFAIGGTNANQKH